MIDNRPIQKMEELRKEFKANSENVQLENATAMADLYESVLTVNADNISLMEALADLYEVILS